MMHQFFKNKRDGFTLVETLVAISIFTMSILALFSVLAKGISNTNYAKTKIIASYLGQEGIEYIRNMRDTFVLYNPSSSQAGWNDFNTKLANGSCQVANGCYFNADNLDYGDTTQPMIDITLTACGASCPPLSFDSSTGKYGYTGPDSDFVRKIQITQVGSPVNEVKVFSTIYWTQGSGNYSMVFSESLFNWME